MQKCRHEREPIFKNCQHSASPLNRPFRSIAFGYDERLNIPEFLNAIRSDGQDRQDRTRDRRELLCENGPAVREPKTGETNRGAMVN
jgi:hypothetical protein